MGIECESCENTAEYYIIISNKMHICCFNHFQVLRLVHPNIECDFIQKLNINKKE